MGSLRQPKWQLLSCACCPTCCTIVFLVLLFIVFLTWGNLTLCSCYVICIWLDSWGSYGALSTQKSLFVQTAPGLEQDLHHPSITSKWLHGTCGRQQATAYPQGGGRLWEEKHFFCQAYPFMHFLITSTNALLRSLVVIIQFSCL